MNNYTVVGYYDNTGELVVLYVEAEDSADAPIAAYKQLKEGNPDLVPDDLVLVEIFQGHLRSLRDDTHTCSFGDWPGMNEEKVVPLYRNYYKCSECGHEWHSDWNCVCNDRCHKCNTEIKPTRSEDLNADLHEGSPHPQ